MTHASITGKMPKYGAYLLLIARLSLGSLKTAKIKFSTKINTAMMVNTHYIDRYLDVDSFNSSATMVSS